MHSVWEPLIRTVRGGDTWAEFFSTVFDSKLSCSSINMTTLLIESLMVSTHGRKFIALKVLETLVLPNMAVGEVPVVLSAAVVTSVRNNAATESHLLHKSAVFFVSLTPHSCQ